MLYGSDTDFDRQEHDLIFDDIEENYYPGMITKTMRGMEYIENNYDYDFLLRTNISTFWDFETLLNRLDREPKENCFTGTLRTCVYIDRKSPNYVSGVDLLLSRDLVQEMVRNQKEVISENLPEDWALSQFFIDRNMKPRASNPRAIHFMEHFTHFDRDLVLKEIESARQQNHDHFRIKSRKHRETIDVEIAKILLQEYYGKTIL